MKKRYRKYINISESEKIADHVFISRMLMSAVAMLVCIFALCSTTYAYFTSTRTSSVATIEAADFKLKIRIGEQEFKIGEAYTYTCQSTEEDYYKFEFTAIGSASDGYCKVTIKDDPNGTYYTNQMKKDDVLILPIQVAEGIEITFEPSWGTSVVYAEGNQTYGVAADAEIKDEDMIVYSSAAVMLEEESENQEKQYFLHNIEEGETLESIAAFYKLTVEELCEYNDIPADTKLIPGEQIAIPRPKEEAKEKSTIEDGGFVAADTQAEGDETVQEETLAEGENNTESEKTTEDEMPTAGGNETGDEAEVPDETESGNEADNSAEGTPENGTDAADTTDGEEVQIPEKSENTEEQAVAEEVPVSQAEESEKIPAE